MDLREPRVALRRRRLILPPCMFGVLHGAETRQRVLEALSKASVCSNTLRVAWHKQEEHAKACQHRWSVVYMYMCVGTLARGHLCVCVFCRVRGSCRVYDCVFLRYMYTRQLPKLVLTIGFAVKWF